MRRREALQLDAQGEGVGRTEGCRKENAGVAFGRHFIAKGFLSVDEAHLRAFAWGVAFPFDIFGQRRTVIRTNDDGINGLRIILGGCEPDVASGVGPTPSSRLPPLATISASMASTVAGDLNTG